MSSKSESRSLKTKSTSERLSGVFAKAVLVGATSCVRKCVQRTCDCERVSEHVSVWGCARVGVRVYLCVGACDCCGSLYVQFVFFVFSFCLVSHLSCDFSLLGVQRIHVGSRWNTHLLCLHSCEIHLHFTMCSVCKKLLVGDVERLVASVPKLCELKLSFSPVRNSRFVPSTITHELSQWQSFKFRVSVQPLWCYQLLLILDLVFSKTSSHYCSLWRVQLHVMKPWWCLDKICLYCTADV